MAEGILWWLVLQLLALLSLAPTLLLFRSLPDRGYGLSKALGLLLPSYGLWALAWAGFLPNGRPTVALVLLLLALATAAVIRRQETRESLAAFFRDSWRLVLVTEAVFTVSFFALALFRAYHPDIAGTEQPMDFAFLNATLRSTYFPPHDPWFSGQPISYYYFGYLIQTLPIQLSGLPSRLGYNLALASLFALTVTGSFSLGYNLVAPRSPRAAPWVGVLAGMLVAVMGNLQGALELVRARGWGSAALWQWIGVNGALTPYVSPSWQPTEHFWWWHATRVINTLRITTGPAGNILAVDDRLDYTITEFPFFSFMLGDLHPHVMALPFVLLALGLALSLLRREGPLTLDWVRREPLAFGGAALILGALGFINSWDLPTYLVVALGALLLGAARWGRVGWPLLGLLAALGGASILLYLPFYLGPKPQAQGPGLVGGVGTWPIHFVIFWGPFLFALGCFLLGRLAAGAREARARPGLALASLGAALVPLALWALGQASVPRLLGQAALSWPTVAGKELSVVPLVLAVAFLLFLLASGARRQGQEESFVLLLALTGFSLTLGTELFFLRDAFGNRMNTMFKFYYQAWVLFAIASAYGIYWVASKLGAGQRMWLALWWAGLAAFLVSALAYPVAASYSRADMFRGKPNLDGLAFVKGLDPAEYEALEWLNTQVLGSPVIVEAPGGSYTEYGRVSSRTGLPTVVQWPGHEMQWRGPGKELGEREQDVQQIYSSSDTALVQRLLNKYAAQYVYVGRLERARYGEGALGRFASFMEVAFQNQGVTIYRVRS